jgi:hypothetical protein
MDMASQHGALAQNDAVTDVTIVSDMGTGHQVTVAAQSGVTVLLFGGAVDGDILSNHIPIAHQYLGGGSPVTDILRLATDYRAGRNPIVFTDFYVPQHGYRVDQFCAPANFHVGSHDTKRANFHIQTYFGTGVDVCQVGDSRRLRLLLAVVLVFNR